MIHVSRTRERMAAESLVRTFEEQFWRSDADFYEKHLTDTALMVFPAPVGVLDRQAVVASITAAARWDDVAMTNVRTTRPAPNMILLTYAATARRAGDKVDYSALVSSLYVEQDGAWKLAFHQHTPSP